MTANFSLLHPRRSTHARMTARSRALARLVLASAGLQTAFFASTASANQAPPAGERPSAVLTVYSSADPGSFDPRQFADMARAGGNVNFAWQVPGFGVVRETRRITIPPPGPNGGSTVLFTDVAQFIDPTTVSFRDLSHPDTVVRSQSYQFDLVNSQKLLERYLSQPIRVTIDDGQQPRTFAGTLLSATGGSIVLQSAEGVQILPAGSARIELSELPGGLLTRPTLVWDLLTRTPGEHEVQLSYQTAGLTWRADYNLTISPDETKADLSAWVTLLNMAGGSWKDAGLKLVAGEVQRIQPRQAMPRSMMMRGAAAAEAMDLGFEEKSFFEYHLYTLPRRVDIDANSSQQLVLFPAVADVPVEKVLIMHGTPEFGGWGAPMTDRGFGSGQPVQIQVFFRLVNSRENRMGMPLPAGKVRAYKADSDGSLEFIGEDLIKHTPRDEKLMIKLGNAFDVVGERTVTDFTVDNNRRQMSETIKLEVRNRKDAPSTVTIRENLYRWTNWSITRQSQDFTKVNANTIEFTVNLAANETKEVTYTVQYTW
ncbi:MAG: DUF4139 domain-containing protein [Phycisphaeraceae bacterium]|nr:DUF4139 domain-containing protein [Phycisphaeraceae bacterium]